MGLACTGRRHETPAPRFVVGAELAAGGDRVSGTTAGGMGGKVVYLGLDVSPYPVETGHHARLTHYWKVVVPPGDGWRVFTHASAGNGEGFLNLDHDPAGGEAPVSGWKAGDVIRDQHAFAVPRLWQHRTVEIYVGLARDGKRMPILRGPADGDRRVRAASLLVEGAVAPMTVRRHPVRLIRSRTTLTMDGQLDEADWKRAPSDSGFVDATDGWPSAVETRLRMLRDARALYIAAECLDADLPQEDELRLLVRRGGSGGEPLDLGVGPGRAPQGGATAAVKVDGRRWTAELAIPLGEPPPAAGDVWGLNVVRTRAGPGAPAATTVWSRPFAHDGRALDQLGEIVFTDGSGEDPRSRAKAELEEREEDQGRR